MSTTRRGIRRGLVGAVLLGTWLTAQIVATEVSVYLRQALAALVVVTTLVAMDRRHLATLLRPSTRSLIEGLLAAAVMLAVTYPLAAFVARVWPSASEAKTSLYALASFTSPVQTTALLAVIILAEELLWRGTLIAWLAPRHGWALAGGLSVLLYAAAQAGTGSAEVLAISLVCGLYWTLLRLLTGSLWPPLIAHALWTITVLVLAPL